MKQFFEGLTNPALIKQLYRVLAREYHPDLGGDLEIMKAVNTQYHIALKRADGFVTRERNEETNTDKEYTYKYQESVERDVAEQLAKILALQLPNVEILLIGTWLWVTGDTKPVKDQLKALGFTFHAKRECWCWHSGPRYRRTTNYSLDSIARAYGARQYFGDKTKLLD